ncbi:hypothetical protein ACJMK2_004226, partial [Sinanodonta woodiana]
LIDDTNPILRQLSSTSCHVKDVCDHQPSVSDPCLTIIPRENWFARETKTASYMKVPVLNVFIHHTAMDRCNSTETCTKEMMEIQKFHMDTK